MARKKKRGPITTGSEWYLMTYEPTSPRTSGYWTHDCGATFYSGVAAQHVEGCPDTNSADGYVYHFGPAEVAEIIAHAAIFGADAQAPGCYLTLAELRTYFPALAPALAAA